MLPSKPPESECKKACLEDDIRKYFYKDDEGKVNVNVRFADEDVWLTQAQLAEIYNTTQQNISLHQKSIYADGELDEEATHKKYLLVRQEGKRQVQRDIDHYNLDMIIALGYRVFILPNPKGFRTADFVFERKGVYKMFDLKTIIGKNSVDNRLRESMGQTNRVILNISVDYNSSVLARSIKRYFEQNSDALEVIVLKRKKLLSITRDLTLSSDFYLGEFFVRLLRQAR